MTRDITEHELVPDSTWDYIDPQDVDPDVDPQNIPLTEHCIGKWEEAVEDRHLRCSPDELDERFEETGNELREVIPYGDMLGYSPEDTAQYEDENGHVWEDLVDVDRGMLMAAWLSKENNTAQRGDEQEIKNWIGAVAELAVVEYLERHPAVVKLERPLIEPRHDLVAWVRRPDAVERVTIDAKVRNIASNRVGFNGRHQDCSHKKRYHDMICSLHRESMGVGNTALPRHIYHALDTPTKINAVDDELLEQGLTADIYIWTMLDMRTVAEGEPVRVGQAASSYRVAHRGGGYCDKWQAGRPRPAAEYDYWRLQTNRDFLRNEVYEMNLSDEEIGARWLGLDFDDLDINAE